MNELIEKVEEWARVRRLHTASPKAQALKVIEEFTEMLIAQEGGEEDEIIDGIGDTLVTLIILCKQLDLDFRNILKGFNSLFPRGVKLLWKADEHRAINGLSTGVSKGNLKTVEYSVLNIMKVVSSLALTIDKERVPEGVGVLNMCLQVAYEEIKDRKGMMIDGTFIKYDDLSDENKAALDNA